ncbi:hypothetical protein ACJJTC_002101 [Scirpophaga incertulas]
MKYDETSYKVLVFGRNIKIVTIGACVPHFQDKLRLRCRNRPTEQSKHVIFHTAPVTRDTSKHGNADRPRWRLNVEWYLDDGEAKDKGGALRGDRGTGGVSLQVYHVERVIYAGVNT